MFLEGGEILNMGDSKVKAYFVPCHTKGHIVYHLLPKETVNNH
jgi:glyoxylase-like metal-dependent hydrolase (beta-lactamase superfamily II)